MKKCKEEVNIFGCSNSNKWKSLPCWLDELLLMNFRKKSNNKLSKRKKVIKRKKIKRKNDAFTRLFVFITQYHIENTQANNPDHLYKHLSQNTCIESFIKRTKECSNVLEAALCKLLLPLNNLDRVLRYVTLFRVVHSLLFFPMNLKPLLQCVTSFLRVSKVQPSDIDWFLLNFSA